jgi:hypothetical protein
MLIIPSSWVPNGVLSTRHQALFLAPLPGRKKIFARRVSHAQFFTLFLFFFILLLLASFYKKKTKKLASFIVTFTCLLLVTRV